MVLASQFIKAVLLIEQPHNRGIFNGIDALLVRQEMIGVPSKQGMPIVMMVLSGLSRWTMDLETRKSNRRDDYADAHLRQRWILVCAH